MLLRFVVVATRWLCSVVTAAMTMRALESLGLFRVPVTLVCALRARGSVLERPRHGCQTLQWSSQRLRAGAGSFSC